METLENVIKEYLENQREGVSIYENVVILPMRLSGLGLAYRMDSETTRLKLIEVAKNHNAFKDLDFEKYSLSELASILGILGLNADSYKENVIWDRKESIFLQDLKKWENLPIIENHPKNNKNESGLITTANFSNNQILGKVLKAYHKDSEIWGICALFESDFLYKILDLKSTSPAVISRGIISNNNIVSEKATHYNHLALVEKGFWDCKGNKAFDTCKIKHYKGVLLMPNENEVIEVVEKKDNEAEVKTDNEATAGEESAEVKSDSITDQVATPEATEAKVDEGEESKEELPAVEIKTDEESSEDIKADDEVAEDKEREELIQDMRNLVDSDSTNSLKMPHISGRKKAGAVLSKFLNANFALVDSKYNDIVLSSVGDFDKNKALLIDAYQSLKANANAKIESVAKSARGWQVTRQADRAGFIPSMKKNLV